MWFASLARALCRHALTQNRQDLSISLLRDHVVDVPSLQQKLGQGSYGRTVCLENYFFVMKTFIDTVKFIREISFSIISELNNGRAMLGGAGGAVR